jgi:hypothetical protein
MTRDEIAKAVPGLEQAGAPRGSGASFPYEAVPKGVRINIDYDEQDKAKRFIVELPPRGAELVLKAWGPHPGKSRAVDPGDTPLHCWDTPDGARIELDVRLTYTTPEASFCELR